MVKILVKRTEFHAEMFKQVENDKTFLTVLGFLMKTFDFPKA